MKVSITTTSILLSLFSTNLRADDGLDLSGSFVPGTGQTLEVGLEFSGKGSLETKIGEQLTKGGYEFREKEKIKLTGGDSGTWTYELIDHSEKSVQESGGKRMESPPQPSPILKTPVYLTKADDGSWSSRLMLGAKASEEVKAATQAIADRFTTVEQSNPFDGIEATEGKNWSITDGQVLALVPGEVMTEPKGTGTIRLEEIKEIGGERCAILGVDLQLSGKVVEESQEFDKELKLKGTIIRSLKTKANLETKLSGTLMMQGTVLDLQPVWMKIDSPISIMATQSIQRGKTE